ncbi:SirB2 family protein [Pseudoalteromonas ruthenica]|uniref:SirB2 family protein n=1 Tax=Pseudoalteromonas ruthenica TaxID=151081 RepID=UPI00110C1AE5|nr:SirB2 family protein [Pseudoalteromonas ruthenica]TMO43003.1 transcriptional regulator [Pseudoalteromonas ruthenica]TMO48800.1 transcriptional regulator [Pseudoalteromonas ruthenica]
MDYIALKHTHVLFVVLSVVLFYTRAFSRIGGGKIAANKAVFISSHIVDTLLLLSAIALLVVASINPLAVPWLWQKIVLVVAYIVIGFKLLKAPTQGQKWLWLGVNTLVLLAIGYLAGSKSGFFS